MNTTINYAKVHMELMNTARANEMGIYNLPINSELSIAYYIPNDKGTVRAYLNQEDVKADYRACKDNAINNCEMEGTVIGCLGSMIGMPDIESDTQPMVITNHSCHLGATSILLKKVQELLAGMPELKGGYYIAPSSKHEVIAIPKIMYGRAVEPAEILETIHSINIEVVGDEDFLSDKLFEIRDDRLEVVES